MQFLFPLRKYTRGIHTQARTHANNKKEKSEIDIYICH